jgi:tRNA nucleotidyltransferase (CCA-adding enzyme)
VVRFAALVLPLGEAGPVERLCTRLHAPHAYRDLGRLAAAHHLALRDASRLPAGALLDLLQRLDAFRRPERLADLALAVQADDDADPETPYPPAERLSAAHAAAAAVDAADLAADGLQGPQIAAALRERRLAALAALP